MSDVSLIDIGAGVRQTWAAAGSAVTNVIPATRLYFERAGEGTTIPYCTFSYKDVSAYYGGTEYFSGGDYLRSTQIEFRVTFLATTSMSAFVTALNDALGWSSTNPAGVWTIPNAVKVLSAMPEVEGNKLTEERVNGIDLVVYTTTFTLKIQANRD